MTDKPINPKQERFCQIYVDTGNASEAYRQAYNSKAKQESVAVSASRLLSQANVSLRVEQIREALRANHNITLADILFELEEARKAALGAENPQSSAAVAASMGKAKLLGFDREKKEQPNSKPITITFEQAVKPSEN